jgi:ABC-type branched-subunit amino acid transport system ATPase component
VVGNHSLLDMKRVSRSFKTLMVPVDLDMTMERGKIIGLIGPKGAGKLNYPFR